MGRPSELPISSWSTYLAQVSEPTGGYLPPSIRRFSFCSISNTFSTLAVITGRVAHISQETGTKPAAVAAKGVRRMARIAEAAKNGRRRAPWQRRK